MNASEEQVLFFHWIGRALQQWAAVEGKLEAVASACVHAQDSASIAAGFNAIENFRSKLSFCSKLVENSGKDEQLVLRWDALQTKCSTLSTKRNKIAHGRHKYFFHETPGRRYALVEPNAPIGDGTKPPSGSLCVRNIVEAREEFFVLTRSLANYLEALHGRPEPLQELTGPQPSPPSLRSLRDQIRAELGVLPRPLIRSPRG